MSDTQFNRAKQLVKNYIEECKEQPDATLKSVSQSFLLMINAYLKDEHPILNVYVAVEEPFIQSLRFIATTPKYEAHLLTRTVLPDEAPLEFEAVKSKTSRTIDDMRQSGYIFPVFNPDDLASETESAFLNGTYLVVPIINDQKTCVGLIAADTVRLTGSDQKLKAFGQRDVELFQVCF
jgi:hypothetical protein